MKKNLLSFILICWIVAIFGLPAPSAYASDIIGSGPCGEWHYDRELGQGEYDDNVTWTLDAYGTLSICGNGAMTDEQMSSPPWEEHKNYIKRINIEDGVTNIGETAFEDCSYLTAVNIPNSVISIGESAFEDCSYMTNINIPNSVEYIGRSAFRRCTELQDVFIPDNVKSIGLYAFSQCYNLKSINVGINNQYYSSQDGNLYNKDKTKLIQYMISKQERKYQISDGVTTIGETAFAFCPYLSEIVIPDSVVSIGEAAFYDTALYNNKNNWQNGVLYIDEYLIEADSTVSESYEIKNGTVYIADYAFYDYCKNLTTVIIPDSVLHIGKYSFSSNLTSIKIGKNVKVIDDYAFWFSSLKSIDIPDSVIKIGNGVFQNSKLEYINIPNGVSSIGDDAFNYCYNLEYVSIPPSVASIGRAAFGSCTSLLYIDVDNENQNYKSVNGNLLTKDGTKFLQHPIGQTNTENAEYSIPNGVNIIGDSAFESSYLRKITMPDSVIVIEDSSFAWSMIDEADIGKNVVSIGKSAFWGCDFNTLNIPDNVINIDSCAFGSCTSLTEATIGNGTASIPDEAFTHCVKLTEIKIGAAVKHIGKGAFEDCSSLTNVYYQGNKEEWNDILIDKYNKHLLNANICCLGINYSDYFLSAPVLDNNSIAVNITNNTNYEHHITVTCAAYSNGIFKGVENMTITLPANGTMPVSFTKNTDGQITKYKFLCLDMLNMMKPLCKAKEIELTGKDI